MGVIICTRNGKKLDKEDIDMVNEFLAEIKKRRKKLKDKNKKLTSNIPF